MDYGPGFRGVQELHCGQGETLGRVRLPAGIAAGDYLMHPAFLDACLHVYPLLIEGADEARRTGHGWLPVSVESYSCLRDGIDEAWVHVTARDVGTDGTRIFDIRVYDLDERPVAEIAGLAVRRLSLGEVLPATSVRPEPLYAVTWRESARPALPTSAVAPARWVVFADGDAADARGGNSGGRGRRHRDRACGAAGGGGTPVPPCPPGRGAGRPGATPVDGERAAAGGISRALGADRRFGRAPGRGRRLSLGGGCALGRRDGPACAEGVLRGDRARRGSGPARSRGQADDRPAVVGRDSGRPAARRRCRPSSSRSRRRCGGWGARRRWNIPACGAG